MCLTTALKSQNIYTSLLEKKKNNNKRNAFHIPYSSRIVFLKCKWSRKIRCSPGRTRTTESMCRKLQFGQFLIDFPVYITWRIQVIHHCYILAVWLTHIKRKNELLTPCSAPQNDKNAFEKRRRYSNKVLVIARTDTFFSLFRLFSSVCHKNCLFYRTKVYHKMNFCFYSLPQHEKIIKKNILVDFIIINRWYWNVDIGVMIF